MVKSCVWFPLSSQWKDIYVRGSIGYTVGGQHCGRSMLLAAKKQLWTSMLFICVRSRAFASIENVEYQPQGVKCIVMGIFFFICVHSRKCFWAYWCSEVGNYHDELWRSLLWWNHYIHWRLRYEKFLYLSWTSVHWLIECYRRILVRAREWSRAVNLIQDLGRDFIVENWQSTKKKISLGHRTYEAFTYGAHVNFVRFDSLLHPSIISQNDC